MLYLDYILYLTIAILSFILIKKIGDKKAKEGFDHKGKGYVYTKPDTKSVIKSAVYGSFIDGPKDCVDVKPVLDKLISAATSSMVVSHYTFGVNDPASGAPKYLIINFTTTAITVSDALMQLTNMTDAWLPYNFGWVYTEGDSVSLDFGKGDPTPAWLKMAEAMYKIADLFAYMVIRMPYKFVNDLVETGVNFVENFKDIFAPIMKFYDQMMAIARSVITQMYKFGKSLFDQWLAIVRDIPGFLKAQFNNMINLLQDGVTKGFALFEKLFDIGMTIFNALIQLPMMLFDILDQLTDIGINMFMMIMQLPTSGLNMIIGMQDVMMDLMKKTPTIPFTNLFFK